MKLSDIITTEPIKTMFGKRAGKWRATLVGSDLTGEGVDATEATQALKNIILKHIAADLKRAYFFSKSGKTVFVVYHTTGGWNYDVIRQGMNGPSSCGLNSIYNFEQACKAAKDHADSYED